MRRSLTAIGLLALTLTTVSAAELDWPMFRGADRTGVSKEKGLLKSWPKGGPPLAWKTEGIGIGFSSVSVSGDKIFTMGDVGKDCYLFGIDRAKGEKVWKLRVGKSGGNYQGPRCTPSTDGEFVFALGYEGDFVCAKAKDGKEVWRKSFTKDFSGQAGSWNFTESPLIDGNHVIVTPGGSTATMVALARESGEVVWKGTIDGGDTAGYASVVIANLGNTKQYVTLMANGLVSFDAKTGKMLWRYGTDRNRFGRNTANIPTPIIRGDNVFATAGYGRGGALLKVTKSGDKFAVEELYWKTELNNRHGGVILVGDKLFGDKDHGGQVWCADLKTGELVWTRKGGNGSGSAAITYADEKLYIHYANGWTVLVDATAEKYTELGAFQIPNQKNEAWAHPVVVGGKLYIRNLDTLSCYDVTAK